MEVQINSLAVPAKPTAKHLRHLLGQLGGREVVVDFEFLVGLLICSTGEKDIQKINPVLTTEEIAALKALTVGTILQVQHPQTNSLNLNGIDSWRLLRSSPVAYTTCAASG